MIAMVLILVFAISVGLYAFAPRPPAIPKRIAGRADLDRYLTSVTEAGSPPGLSVVVVKHGHIVYNNAFGYADQPRQIKATPDTVYHWWSMTKIPTAMAIMKLQEEGKLNLRRHVDDYLPWFQVKYPSEASPRVTIHNLLQHSSGLPDTMPAMIGWVHYDHAVRDQTEVARKHLPKFNRLRFYPGSRAAYSNLNYMLLGAVIEAVSGQSYESYIRENILVPLGMKETDFLYTPAMVGHQAAGTLPVVHLYTPLLPFLLDPRALIREREGKLLWLNPVYIDATPSTGLIGPAPDLARLMLAYLNGGTLDGRRILAPESISLLTDAETIDGRGLGWFVGGFRGVRYLQHPGGGPGFATIMRLYPDQQLGIAILCNGTDLKHDGLMGSLASIPW